MGKTVQAAAYFSETLLKEIRSGVYADANALPPEIELAQKYNVSRNIVRECLTRLERDGWVTRRQGVGTLINKNVVHEAARLDLNYELLQTIIMNGKVPETTLVRSRMMEADALLSGKLQIPEGSKVLRVSRMIRADGKPAVYCIDYIADALFDRRDYKLEDLEPPIFNLLHHFCGGVSVETSLAELRAVPVTEEVARALEIPLTCSLLYLSEVSFDYKSTPLLYSEEYLMDGVIRHTIVRKKFK